MPRRLPDGLPAILPAALTRLERRLPADGELLVRMGARVEPDDLIGQCSVQHDPVLLDVAGALGVEPRDLRRALRAQPGTRVPFRDLLARLRGRSLYAPFTGTLTAVDDATGFVVMTPDPVPASVAAMIRGYVVDLQPNRAATIETPGAVVQGAFGFGGEQWGVLRLLVGGPADVLTPELIDGRGAFSLVIGGAGITAEALRKAQREQVKGIIVGSVDAEELREFWGHHFEGPWDRVLGDGANLLVDPDMPTLFVTEGFGVRPMSRPIFDLLARFDRQEAYLDGTTRLHAPQRRPRLIVPLARLPDAAAPPRPLELRPGAVVRLLDEPHLGVIGRVESMSRYGRLPSAVRTAVATVQIGDDERIMLPEVSLEVIA